MADKKPIPTIQDEEDPEETIRFPDPCTKYKTSAEIVEAAMNKVLAAIAPGKAVRDLCVIGDNELVSLTSQIFKGKNIDKGIAMPTCISVNHIIAHYSPLMSEAPILLKEGDVVKIDMGAHIDGYIASAAHTTVCTANLEQKIEGRKADVYCAAYQAFEAALRLLKPGNKNSDVTAVIEAIAAAYHCTPVNGLISHNIRRCIIDGPKVILNKQPPADQKVDVFTFEENEVYCLDIVISTGDGKTRDGETKTTVFKRNVDAAYQLKVQTSRQILSEIHKKFPYLPFSLRLLENENKARMGITELVNHELVSAYPVIAEKQGEFVAQFKSTVLITTKQTDRLNSWAPSHVSSVYSITNPDILNLLSTGLKRASKNKKKKVKAAVEGAEKAAPAATTETKAEASMEIDK